MNKVTCDDCGRSFSPRLYEAPVEDGAEQRFNCPGCERQYVVAHITTAGLKLRRKVARARKAEDHAAYQDLLAQFQAEVTRA